MEWNSLCIHYQLLMCIQIGEVKHVEILIDTWLNLNTSAKNFFISVLGYYIRVLYSKDICLLEMRENVTWEKHENTDKLRLINTSWKEQVLVMSKFQGDKVFFRTSQGDSSNVAWQSKTFDSSFAKTVDKMLWRLQ